MSNPTKALFENLFTVMVPAAALMCVEDMEEYGTRTSGDSELDIMLSENDIRVMLTIDAMVEHFKDGYSIKVLTQKDVTEIYGIIEDHLMLWLDHINNSRNKLPVPYEDLILLDEFASTIHANNKRILSAEINSSFLNQFKPKINMTQQSIRKSIAPIEDRESLAESFRPKKNPINLNLLK